MEMTHFDKSEGFFLLLLRGGCSFSTKVKNAQAFGAELVIVSDYKDQATADEETAKIDDKFDGMLQSHVPAFEVSWEDAKKLVEFIHLGDDNIVYLKAAFDVTNSDNTVEVDLWYSTSLDLGMNLANELAAMSKSYSPDHADKPLFTPRIATYECINCSEEFKKANCMSEG